jgi:hypothetical protein
MKSIYMATGDDAPQRPKKKTVPTTKPKGK